MVRSRDTPAAGSGFAVRVSDGDDVLEVCLNARSGFRFACSRTARDGDAASLDRLRSSLRAYGALIRDHIKKEESVLYPLIDRTVPEARDADLVERMLDQQRKAMSDEAYASYTGIEVITRPARSAGLDARTLAHDGNEARPEEWTAVSMRAGRKLFERGDHRVWLLHDFGRGLSVQANQYLIVSGSEGIILDPGGPKVYPDVLAETMAHLGGAKLTHIFLSHQDPDIGTSLNAWMMDTEADAYVSQLWLRFLPHYGIDRYLEHHLKPIPDAGMFIEVGSARLMAVPAHFLHSAGNFQLYDPVSKILFTGDLGASVGQQLHHFRASHRITALKVKFGGDHKRSLSGPALRFDVQGRPSVEKPRNQPQRISRPNGVMQCCGAFVVGHTRISAKL